MNPLVTSLAVVFLLSLPAAAKEEPFKRGVSVPEIQKVFNIVLPPAAEVSQEVIRADEFVPLQAKGGKTFPSDLFAGAKDQCAAASSPFSEVDVETVHGYIQVETHRFVLAKKGNAYQVYRFWVAASLKGSAKSGAARRRAEAKLEPYKSSLSEAIDSAKCP